MKDLDKEEIIKISSRLLEIKKLEASIKCEREIIELALIDWLGVKEEGAQTHDIGDYKITITSKLTRTLDGDKWDEIKAGLPEQYRLIVDWKPSLDLKGLRWVQENEPDIYKKVAQAVTIKPAKTSVVVKSLINQEEE